MTETRISLGGGDYRIRPLTLGQLRTILPAFARAARLDAEDGIDAAIEILAAALGRDHASLTREALLEMEVPAPELAAAIAAIARLSGLIEARGAAASGEAQAGR